MSNGIKLVVDYESNNTLEFEVLRRPILEKISNDFSSRDFNLQFTEFFSVQDNGYFNVINNLQKLGNVYCTRPNSFVIAREDGYITINVISRQNKKLLNCLIYSNSVVNIKKILKDIESSFIVIKDNNCNINIRWYYMQSSNRLDYTTIPETISEDITSLAYPYIENLDSFIESYIGSIEPVMVLVGLAGCHLKGTPILMFDGSIKPVEEICVDDKLMGPDSESRKVLSLHRGKEMMYKITPVKGEPFIVNEHHILSLRCKEKVKDISVKDYLSESYGSALKKTYKLYRGSIEFNKNEELPLDPYFVGVYIGDGSKHDCCVTTMDPEIVSAIEEISKEFKLQIHKVDQPNNKSSMYWINNGPRGRGGPISKLWSMILDMGINTKEHIPQIYLTSSRKDRLSLLAGIIDTDGHISPTPHCDILMKHESLCDDVIFLCRSLGFAAYKSEKNVKLKNWSEHRTYYRVSISGEYSTIPTRINRKNTNHMIRKQVKNVLHTGFSIEPYGIDNYYGFELDSDGLYLMGDFTVTHNSGKTKLLRHIVRALSRDVLIKAKEKEKRNAPMYGDTYSSDDDDFTPVFAYTNDSRAMQSDEIFVDFIGDSSIHGLVMEDMDDTLKPRDEGNSIMSKLLSSSDGFITNYNKKMILTSNIANINNIDAAFKRPGRCFSVVKTRKLTGGESIELLRVLSPDKNYEQQIDLNGEFSLAELYKLVREHTLPSSRGNNIIGF